MSGDEDDEDPAYFFFRSLSIFFRYGFFFAGIVFVYEVFVCVFFL